MDAALQDSLKNCLMFLVIDPIDQSVFNDKVQPMRTCYPLHPHF